MSTHSLHPGVAWIDCPCGRRHPSTRGHCTVCGAPSLILWDGICRTCGGDQWAQEASDFYEPAGDTVLDLLGGDA